MIDAWYIDFSSNQRTATRLRFRYGNHYCNWYSCTKDSHGHRSYQRLRLAEKSSAEIGFHLTVNRLKKWKKHEQQRYCKVSVILLSHTSSALIFQHFVWNANVQVEWLFVVDWGFWYIIKWIIVRHGFLFELSNYQGKSWPLRNVFVPAVSHHLVHVIWAVIRLPEVDALGYKKEWIPRLLWGRSGLHFLSWEFQRHILHTQTQIAGRDVCKISHCQKKVTQCKEF